MAKIYWFKRPQTLRRPSPRIVKYLTIVQQNRAEYRPIHSFYFIRTIFIRTLRQRFSSKFKKIYGLSQIVRVLIKKRVYLAEEAMGQWLKSGDIPQDRTG